MSRTDKTNPYFVKQYYHPSYLAPVHRHEYHDCDLPPKPLIKNWRHSGRWMGKWEDPCFWWPTFTYYRSRWAKCGCPMCKKFAYEPDPNRARRRKDRRYCEDGWRDEY